jgi:FKBP-type peptidyl-prolyl cis-trans isomerase FklB
MRVCCSILAFTFAFFCSSTLPAQAPAATSLKTDKDKTSYGFGLNVGRGMLRDGLVLTDVDFNLLIAGLSDALNQKPLALTEKEFEEAFKAYIQPKLEEREKIRMAKVKTDGEAFLTKNKANADVKTTASGLQYKVLKAGTGASPKATDVVKTMYKGTFIDGNVFDASQSPVEFPVNRVIKGWTEALQLMKTGDKWQLFVPSDLAYGEQGMPGAIPPHSVLVFEVELIEVVAPSTTPPAAPK